MPALGLAALVLSGGAQASPVQVGLGLSDVFASKRPVLTARFGAGWVRAELSGSRAVFNVEEHTLERDIANLWRNAWPVYEELGNIKAVADFCLPRADTEGWFGSPHLYLGAQMQHGYKRVVIPSYAHPDFYDSPEPPARRGSPLMGVGISLTRQKLTGRVTVHRTREPSLYGSGRDPHTRGSLDLLYRF
jgi:hypothetical protein